MRRSRKLRCVSHIFQGERNFLRPFERTDAELYRRWRAEAAPMALAGWPDGRCAEFTEYYTLEQEAT